MRKSDIIPYLQFSGVAGTDTRVPTGRFLHLKIAAHLLGSDFWYLEIEAL